MINERCPVCHGEITDYIMTSYPPIYRKTCRSCGRSWEKKEDIKDVVFNPEGWEQSND